MSKKEIQNERKTKSKTKIVSHAYKTIYIKIYKTE